MTQTQNLITKITPHIYNVAGYAVIRREPATWTITPLKDGVRIPGTYGTLGLAVEAVREVVAS